MANCFPDYKEKKRQKRVILTTIASTNTYALEYFIKDQLGDVRAVVGDKNNNGIFEVASDLLQVSDFYAFGREISNGTSTSPGENYKCNRNSAGTSIDQLAYKYLDVRLNSLTAIPQATV